MTKEEQRAYHAVYYQDHKEELEKCVVLCEPCHKRRHVEMCVVAA